MLVQSQIVKRMFDVNAALVPAVMMVNFPGIYIDETIEEVEYYHILFDRHQVIFAEGALSESLYTGPEALEALSPEARDEIMSLFPELRQQDYSPRSAALIPARQKRRKLVHRHARNGKPLVSEFTL